MWKSNLKMSKEKWLLILVCGVILLILSFPTGGRAKSGNPFSTSGSTSNSGTGDALKTGSSAKIQSSQNEEREYEKLMEDRVKAILKNVDGVGAVDVMITLKSSKEKVLRVDKEKSRSSTEEKDSTGGTRNSMSEEIKETTLTGGSGTTGEPVVEKEIQPEIEGIIISAQGGGSSVVRSEISQAMEALFDIPVHKIKVLKRVE